MKNLLFLLIVTLFMYGCTQINAKKTTLEDGAYLLYVDKPFLNIHCINLKDIDFKLIERKKGKDEGSFGWAASEYFFTVREGKLGIKVPMHLRGKLINGYLIESEKIDLLEDDIMAKGALVSREKVLIALKMLDFPWGKD